MHSKIYQIGLNPMNVDDYVHPDEFYENSNGYADYIGDEFTDDEREDIIKYIPNLFPGVLEYVGDSTLQYKGINTFLNDWVSEIKRMADELTPENILRDLRPFRLSRVPERTHMDLNSRFFIEGWNDCAGTASDLIEFLAKQEKGTLIYVGAVIDFHF